MVGWRRPKGYRQADCAQMIIDQAEHYKDVERRMHFTGTAWCQMHGCISLSGYNDHPLVPSPRLQHCLEHFDGQRWRTRNIYWEEHYTRHHPVERSFFAQFKGGALDCVRHTHRMPPEASACTHEPKYSCGPVRALRQGCHVFSIGSADQTCFEEHIHEVSPGCTINVFDPSVTGKRGPLAAAQRSGVLRFHQVGLGAKPEMLQYRDYVHDFNATTAAKNGRKRYITARSMPLLAMMQMVQVDWIDYLKVKCVCIWERFPRSTALHTCNMHARTPLHTLVSTLILRWWRAGGLRRLRVSSSPSVPQRVDANLGPRASHSVAAGDTCAMEAAHEAPFK